MPGLVQEFKRRNVFRVAMAYIVITWLVLQVADTAVPLLRLPDWVSSFVFLILGLFFIPTLVFSWAFELTPDGLKRQIEVDRDDSITGETGKKLDYVTIGALVLVLVIVASERYLFPEASAPEPASATTVVGEISIAVLPFADMSPNRDQDYFSDGITEEILNGLAKLKTMKVAGRTSSFAFKGRNEDLREIGEALGVQHVVEGSVRKDGDQLRITAQLISVNDGFHIWSETYDRELKDVFAVQDEISAAIVSELQGSLLGEPVAGADDAVEIDVATYEKYLVARKLIHTRTNEGLTDARSLLEEIVAAAPDFAPGLSSLAETLVLLKGGDFLSYGDLAPELVAELATPLLQRAIKLDPNLSDAYAVRGLLNYRDREKNDQAVEDLRRAIELNPSSSKAWLWLANSMNFEDKLTEAQEYMARAAAIDPLWLVPNSNLVRYKIDYGRRDEAWEVLERLRPFQQDSASFHNLDARVKALQGDLADAHRANAKAYALSPDTPSIAVQHAGNLVDLQNFKMALDVVPPQFSFFEYYVTGEWDRALPKLSEMIAANPDFPVPWFVYTTGANYIGDFEGIVDLYDTHIQSPDWIISRRFEDLMLQLVPALRALDREAEAQVLLNEYHKHLVSQDALGLSNANLDDSWSTYLALNGEHKKVLPYMQSSFEKGSRNPFWQYSAELEPLQQDPDFIALKAANLTAINAERADLGWGPVPEIGVFYDADSEM